MSEENRKPYYPEDIRAKYKCFGCGELQAQLATANEEGKRLRGLLQNVVNDHPAQLVPIDLRPDSLMKAEQALKKT